MLGKLNWFCLTSRICQECNEVTAKEAEDLQQYEYPWATEGKRAWKEELCKQTGCNGQRGWWSCKSWVSKEKYWATKAAEKKSKEVDFRSGSRTAATSKMECFVIIVNNFQLRTIISKHSILDVVAVLALPLDFTKPLKRVITGGPQKCLFFFGNNFYKNKETFKIFFPEIREVYRILNHSRINNVLLHFISN